MRRLSRTWLGGFLALLFAAALILTQTPDTALASSDREWHGATDVFGTATVNNLTEGDTVQLRQVEETGLEAGVLTHAWLGGNYSFTPQQWIDAGQETDHTKIEAYSNEIAAAVNASPSTFTGFPAAPVTVTAADNGTITFSDLPAGLYYVVVVPAKTSIIYQNTTLAVVPQPVSGLWYDPVGTVDLKFTDLEGNGGVTNEVSDKVDGTFGDSVNNVGGTQTAYYQSNLLVPKYEGTAAELDKRAYVFKATIDGFLAVKDDVKVLEPKQDDETPGADVTSLFTVVNTPGTTDGAGGSTAGTLTLTLNGTDAYTKSDFLLKNANQTLTLTYSAVVDPSFTAAADSSLDNAVNLTYSRLSYDDGTAQFTTPDQTSSVKVFGVEITLTDKDDASVFLQNGHFTVYRGTAETDMVDANKIDVDLVTAADGKVILPTLGYGDYLIHETQKPAGYSIVSDPTVFKVSTEDIVSAGLVPVGIENESGGTEPSQFLPQTGGPGTIALTVVGVVLMVAAFVWVARSRKHD